MQSFLRDADGIEFEADKSRPSTSWVESSFTFEKPVEKQVVMPVSRSHIGTSFTTKRRMIFLICMGAIFFIAWSRVAYMQLWRGHKFRVLADSNRQRIVPIPAERGIIFDRRGRQLTKNFPNFSLAVVPQNLPRDQQKLQDLVQRLAELATLNREEIWGIIKEYGSYSYESIVIEENLDYNTALLIQIAASDLPGIAIVQGSKRLYLYDFTPSANFTSTTAHSLSHIIGYEGKLSRSELDQLYASGYTPADFIGKSGLEKTYETYLRGGYGKKRIEVNALGREQNILAETPPIPGKHLTISIDAAMQQALEGILQKTLIANHKYRAAAVALDPRNGEIMALVSLPSFDNNDFSGGIKAERYSQYSGDKNQPLFDRAIGGLYPSGSTIKPAIASAALEEGIITPNSVVLSTGGIHVGQWFFPDWLAGGHGWTDVRKSLAQSVNTFYYYIGGGYQKFKGLGVERLEYYFRQFGFGHELEIDVPGEAAGFLPSEGWKQKVKKEVWYIGDTYNLSIGEGDILVTPLQIAAMTMVVANGGTLYKPQILKTVTNPVNGQNTNLKPTVIRMNIIHDKHLETVRLGMRDCVTSGSCRRLASLPIAVAGKTGTAQWRADKANHAWFTSFAPFDNPEIVVTVLIEEGGEGSSMAAPVADEFYRWWSKYTKHFPVDKLG